MAAADYFRLIEERQTKIIELILPVQLDAREFDAINDQVQRLVDAQPQAAWVMDLGRVDYKGSAMLGLMVNVRQRVKSGGGQLVLCGLSPRLVDIFQACSLERLFKFARTREDAVRLTSR
jgi:anti-anti-sigma factor